MPRARVRIRRLAPTPSCWRAARGDDDRARAGGRSGEGTSTQVLVLFGRGFRKIASPMGVPRPSVDRAIVAPPDVRCVVAPAGVRCVVILPGVRPLCVWLSSGIAPDDPRSLPSLAPLVERDISTGPYTHIRVTSRQLYQT